MKLAIALLALLLGMLFIPQAQAGVFKAAKHIVRDGAHAVRFAGTAAYRGVRHVAGDLKAVAR